MFLKVRSEIRRDIFKKKLLCGKFDGKDYNKLTLHPRSNP